VVLEFLTASEPVDFLTFVSGSVLLIDDMVDSRWTMTVASWLLRSNGSGVVFPLALALTGRAA
jgi:ATP-dependent DNA helicase RecQ